MMYQDFSSPTFFFFLIVLLLILILITLLALLIYSGLFTPVNDIGTGTPPVGQAVIAYKFQKGPYNESGQIFTEAAIIAPDNKALAIYYDDRYKTLSCDCRYIVGSIVSQGSSPIDEEMVKKFTDNDFKIIHLPEVEYAVKTSFPHITTLSVNIATYKAYPEMHYYIEERKLCAYPFLEYYDGHTIHFMAPLSKQDEFFVPECRPDTADEDTLASTTAETNLQTSHSTFDESFLKDDLREVEEKAQEEEEEEENLKEVKDDGSDLGEKLKQENQQQVADASPCAGDSQMVKDVAEERVEALSEVSSPEQEKTKQNLPGGEKDSKNDSENDSEERVSDEDSSSSFEVLKHDA